MLTENSLSQVFRFVQLRPPLPPGTENDLALMQTDFAQTIATADVAERRQRSRAALNDGATTVGSVGDLAFGEQLEVTARQLDDQPISTFVEATAALSKKRGFGSELTKLSDTLLAMFFAGHESIDRRDFTRLYRLYLASSGQQQGRREESLFSYLERPISLSRLGRRSRTRSRRIPAREGSIPLTGRGVAIGLAIDELLELDALGLFDSEAEDGVAFTASTAGLERLSTATKDLLEERGIELSSNAILDIVAILDQESRLSSEDNPDPESADTTGRGRDGDDDPFGTVDAGRIRSIGSAELLVVKQQIKRYERSEVAHIEALLAGEAKTRTHRTYERTEEIFTTEAESTTESESELETADRFELNREAERTIQRDVQVGGGLTVSGKYGPTVEFTSNLSMNRDVSSQQTQRSAANFSRDVVQRSLERVSERVREQRIRRIIREAEETNVHSLSNDTGDHRSGVYQFVDKIYEAQILNYGFREMFDFMIPEPGSFVWWLKQNPTASQVLPEPPAPLQEFLADASDLTPADYMACAAQYGALDVEPPPPMVVTVVGSTEHGSDDADEGGEPTSKSAIEVDIPAGYDVAYILFQGLALTDDDPVIAFAVGGHPPVIWQPEVDGADALTLDDTFDLAHGPVMSAAFGIGKLQPGVNGKITIPFFAWETDTYSVTATVRCRRTAQTYREWQLATYRLIRDAYESRLAEYETRMAEAEAELAAASLSEAPYGAPPSQNRKSIRDELKKQCISIVTEQFFDAIRAAQVDIDSGPIFDLDRAAQEGSYIRFIEHAFEWDQIQYVLYPYFWGRKSETWPERFQYLDPDPEFRDFMRAGAARVVVPVRPGFESALIYFLDTGTIWQGEGEPDLFSDMYVSIVDEIKARTGADQGETLVGEPWEIRVPTALVALRPGDDLPVWERPDNDEWAWTPVELQG